MFNILQTVETQTLHMFIYLLHRFRNCKIVQYNYVKNVDIFDNVIDKSFKI